MKQIITVLAILISGIASAQLFEVSICQGEIVHNDERYTILQELKDEIESTTHTNQHGINFVCVDEVRVANGVRYISRYFRRYLGAGAPNTTGDEYTGREEDIHTYDFPNDVQVRFYPANYADGGSFTRSDGRSGRRSGLVSLREERAGKFEVRRDRNRSTPTGGDRWFDDGKSAYDWASNR